MDTSTAGTYTVKYNVTDTAGNVADEVVRTVNVVNDIQNEIPVANAGNNQNVIQGVSVTFDASSGFDPDGNIVSWSWKEGDIVLSNNKIFSKNDFDIGLHIITLTVMDNNNDSNTDSSVVLVKKTGGDSPQPPTDLVGWNEIQDGIRIAFKDNSDNENGFRIYDDNDDIISVVAEKNGVRDTVYYNITGFFCGSMHTISVVSYNDYGESNKSNDKSFRTKECSNVLPVATIITDSTEVQHGETVSFECKGTDSDGSIVRHRILKDSNVVAINNTDSDLQYSTSDFSIGDNVYKCEVKDDRGGIDLQSITITVTSVDTTAYVLAQPSIITEGET